MNCAGTDSFTYQVDDGRSSSRLGNATVTLFGSDRDIAKQIGGDIDGEAGVPVGGGPGDRSGTPYPCRVMAVGAPNDNVPGLDAVGSVRVFEWNGIAWRQIGARLTGVGSGDQFGFFLRLSGDGDTVRRWPNAGDQFSVRES